MPLDDPETFIWTAAGPRLRRGDFDRNGVPMENFVTISGCSGGGKSKLLQELRQRGFATIAEPGRRIVAEELRRSGRALPWVDAHAFAAVRSRCHLPT